VPTASTYASSICTFQPIRAFLHLVELANLTSHTSRRLLTLLSGNGNFLSSAKITIYCVLPLYVGRHSNDTSYAYRTTDLSSATSAFHPRVRIWPT
jgi:hypothetical protein